MATEVVVNIIISIAVLDAICIVLVQGLVRNGFDVDFKGDLGGEADFLGDLFEGIIVTT